MLTTKRLAKAALAVVLSAGTVLAQDARPSPAPLSKAQNQNTAEAVASELKASAMLRGYKIDITSINGRVELSGVIGDQGQRDEAIRIAQSVPGVERVESKLSMTNPGTIKQAQATGEGQLPQPRKVEMPGEPVPSFRAGLPSVGMSQTPPPLPPYGWPTYAPYNNYSRVAYPTAYPYEAFPFIGPVHPFPKVPLGWRNVKLEWDDGHWWLSSHSQRRDWWMLRYW
jgi:hypothetical protein